MEMTTGSKKTATGQAAVIMGAATVALGMVMCVLFHHALLCAWLFLAVVAANGALHLACFKANNAGSPTTGLMIMTVAEFCTVLFALFSLCFFGGEYVILVVSVIFAYYLIVNGAALVAIPSILSRRFGTSGICTGLLLFAAGAGMRELFGLAAGVSLAVNGAERVIMSLHSRKN